MGKKDPRIDAYIEKSKDFAKPILKHVRELVHKAVPEAEETMKWSMPHFDYLGEMMFMMASFKEHMAMGFWKVAVMNDPDKLLNPNEAMGNFGRIKSIKDLPSDKIMIKYLKEAARLNKEGIKNPSRTKPADKKELEVPDYFTKALSKNKAAKMVFDEFSYSKKKEYVEWITEAKTEATRDKRMEQAVEWIAEGKTKNWKYQNC
ncbi:MAG: YdeI/OmpD-associated family protein [Ignavibacteria bacterium]|nr:YdeI/OmpD-associated family protein [Ignavibacteria bacterium]